MKKIMLQGGHGYLAGIIDGEGWVSIKKGKGRKSPKFEIAVGVSNTDKRLIDLLDSYIKGHRRMRTKQSNWKTEYSWEIRNLQAYKFLQQIIPYLYLKKERALLCMKMVESTMNIKERDERGRIKSLSEKTLEYRLEIFSKVKELNQRGVLYA